MTRGQLLLTFLALVAVLILLCAWGWVHFAVPLFAVNDRGSPELALEWKTALMPLADPEEAEQKNSRVQAKHFRTGEWVFGLCQNSHGLQRLGGGTVVVKDSRGSVRAFFGHVCGPDWLNGCLKSCTSLDGFYRTIEAWDFHEFRLTVDSRPKQLVPEHSPVKEKKE